MALTVTLTVVFKHECTTRYLFFSRENHMSNYSQCFSLKKKVAYFLEFVKCNHLHQLSKQN